MSFPYLRAAKWGDTSVWICPSIFSRLLVVVSQTLQCGFHQNWGRNFRHRGDFMQRFNEMYRGASGGGGGEMGRGAAVGGREGDVDEDDDGRR